MLSTSARIRNEEIDSTDETMFKISWKSSVLRLTRPEEESVWKNISIILAVAWPTAMLSAPARTYEEVITTQEEYLEARAPRRLALVIGNYHYTELGDLPGVKSDIEHVAAQFKDLKFDVVETYANLKTARQFELEALKPFRSQVMPDDLVVVYMSGHGFTYGGFQYFAPTTMPLKLVQGKIAKTAIPIETLVDLLGNEGAGGVVLIVDACRNVPNFDFLDDKGGVLDKGENSGRPQRLPINYIMALSVQNGSPSKASADPDTMSVYTKSLVKHLGMSADFRFMHDEVEQDVIDETDEKQIPGTIDWTRTNIVLSASEKWRSEEREAWESLLRTNERSAIERFVKKNTLNPYVPAARKWLEDNPPEKTPGPQVSLSAIGVDAAWKLGRPLEGLSTLVAYPRTMTFDGSLPDLDAIARFGLQSVAASAKPTSSTLAVLSDQIAQSDDLFGGAEGNIYSSPKIDADIIARFEPGEQVEFNQVVRTEVPEIVVIDDIVNRAVCRFENSRLVCDTRLETVQRIGPDPIFVPRSWIELSIPKGSTAAPTIGYVGIDANNSSWDINVGRPFKEFFIKAREGAPDGLVEREPIDAATQASAATGASISWVSIAAAPEGEDTRFDGQLMISNAAFLFENSGIPQDRISAVRDDPTVPNSQLRVRIYISSIQEE
jgi:hypothetical protein